MDDGMIDLMAGDAILRRRLEAYAELRLSPDLATSARLRARVLAHAHRRADLARANASLTVVAPVVDGTGPPRDAAGRRLVVGAWRRLVVAASMAAIAVALVGGASVAARAGGPLYDARLWAETITLPSEPSARAVAELERLERRIVEADNAALTGDFDGAAMALAAYERILDEASAEVLTAHDAVGAAALETGVGRNVEVLRELVGRVPAAAIGAIEAALERAIERSGAAIDRVDDVGKPGPDQGDPNRGIDDTPVVAPPTERPTPTARPTPKPKPSTGHPAADPTPRPARESSTEPTPKPPSPNKPDKTDKPPKPEPRVSPGPAHE